MLPTRLRGAKIHNLKGLDLEIRPGEVVALTGVSGAGKSSLALDTLYAEGQRRFVESFSPYARQFLERLERPPMESLNPVGAGVAVDRSAPVKSSRSSVATMADLEPYLAGLFAQASTPHCPEHGVIGTEVTLADAYERALAIFEDSAILVAYRVLIEDLEDYLEKREAWQADGYRRLICDGEVLTIDELKPSQAVKDKMVFIVLDRLTLNAKSRIRFLEATERAFSLSKGVSTAGQVWYFSGEESLELREGLSCPECARELLPPRPGYFSYESPLGACQNCRGFGRVVTVDLDKVIPDDSLSLAEGAIRPWRGPKSSWERTQLKKFCSVEGISMNTPWSELKKSEKLAIYEGTGKKSRANYWGISQWFEWLESKSYKMHVRVLLSRYRSYETCPSCAGARLNEHALSYQFGDLDLGAWHRLEITEALSLLEKQKLDQPQAKLLKKELSSRLRYLERVGLGYLSLDRQSRTLSGGETQRVTLTAALGTSLHNALFVLDEPTVGLHAGDIEPLSELIRELAARHNAVILIEHDPRLIACADRVIELGPSAGEAGGEIVFDGSLAQALKQNTATARAFSGAILQVSQATVQVSNALRLTGAQAHNLKNIDAVFPLDAFVVVSGSSGSGKSSLVVDTLYRALARQLGQFDTERAEAHKSLSGGKELKDLQLVDTTPLGRTSRGNPATYTKAWDAIRKAFAQETTAIAAGYTASTFSFNVAGGRCEACSGEGYETVEMQFLADVSLRCPVCQGRRFKDEVLEVEHQGLSIADVLELTIDKALEVFGEIRAVRKALLPLIQLGLGYVRLGQPLSTLSGGEAQRLKLARALASPKPKTLYILDEPSAGLHADEVKLLVEALRLLVRSGGSVIVIDHDLDVLKSSDWILELGPGGGAQGGEIVYSGDLAGLKNSNTATALALAAQSSLSRRKSKHRIKASPEQLQVTGAREHTLKEVSVTIPHQKLTVVTGPSGSGKSTLAFDVVFAEGQRRFLETLTPYARRFLPALPRPNVDSVEGVPPSIALEQRTTRIGRRSTVATVTELAHYLRLAFAKIGQIHCPDHDRVIESQSPEELLTLLRRRGQSKLSLMAPVVRDRKGTYLDVFTAAERAGHAFALADSKRVATATPPKLAKTREHSIDIILKEDISASALKLEDIQAALKLGRGSLSFEAAGEVQTLSTAGACGQCGFSVGELDPRYFSFNTRQGQCERCEGTGLEPQAKTRGKKSAAASQRKTCKSCAGARLSPLARKVQFDGMTYVELTSLSVLEAKTRLAKVKFKGRSAAIYEPIAREISRRLSFLSEVGLDYLNLDRDASTLSGGEMQRLRLAAQLGAGLTGALYILDEPTIGLHPRDTGRLLENLRKLVAGGSSVIVVEHDEEAILAADYLIDMGPGGGSHGGQVVAHGAPKKVLSSKNSPTAIALASARYARERLPVTSKTPKVSLEGAELHNLKKLKVDIPHARFNVVAGVSGSGKSTLIRSVLLPALRKKLGLVTEETPRFSKLSGTDGIVRAISVDQSPIGRTPRSIPATFLGIFDLIRKLFAKMPEAQIKGFGPSRFSFNTPAGGRCTACDGQGVTSHEMSFLPDVVTPCSVCNGQRFEERTLEVRYQGLSIGQILGLSAEQALEVFANHPKIKAPLQVLHDLGAGYITLGQGSHTLSGGEAQRLKLAAELCAGSRHEPTLYVLDEPTTGLHLSDVDRLLRVMNRLVERGDTLVVIEHHPDVMRAADYLIELGPEGGPQGGKIVYAGAPEGLTKKKTPTAKVLFGTAP